MIRRHSAEAALRGEPGYVWRSGQERRLRMIQRWVELSGYILDDGCGLGTYLGAMEPFSQHRFGLEIEYDRALRAISSADGIVQGVGEYLPFADDTFDVVLSNEVVEHAEDDYQYAAEMVRVVKPAGRVLLFCPNRWYPVEQHGIFWKGNYRFGNVPLVGYLPNALRNRLAPHVRTYTTSSLRRLFRGLSVVILHHSRIFGGYDNVEARWPSFGRLLKRSLYSLEATPLATFGLSHLIVLEKQATP
jgi:SAM-dependent methyltransferase